MITPFNICASGTFETWFTANQARLNVLWGIVNTPIDPNDDQSAQYIHLSDQLENIKGEALAYMQQAEEYYSNWLADKTAQMAEAEPEAKRKTLLDHAKKLPCNEKRIYDLIVSLNDTIDFRGSQIQSKLKYFKVV